LTRNFGLVVVLIAAATRASSYGVALTQDTGQMLYGGTLVLHGGTPYRDAALIKGPTRYLFSAVLRLVAGRSALGVRLCLLGAAVVAALALAKYLRRISDARIGVTAGVAFAAFAAIATFEGEDPDLEQFAVAPMALALLFASGDSLISAAVSGTLLGVVGLVSPVFLIPLAPAVVWTMWWMRSRRWRDLLGAGLAGVAVVGAVALWLLIGGALSDISHQVPGTFGGPPTGHLLSLTRLAAVPARRLWLTCLPATAVAFSQRRLRVAATCALGWIILSWARVKVGDYLDWDPEYDHHYYPAFVGLCAGLALGLGAVWSARPRFESAVLTALVTVPLFVTLVVVPERDAYAVPLATRGIGAQPWGDAYPLTAWIDAHARADQPVMVSGSEPQVYWLADRFASTRLFDVYAILAHRPYERELMSDLYDHPPRAVVAVAYDLPDAYLARFLTNLRYRLVYSTRAGRIWTGPGGR
jgi:hypothetical protein